MQYFNRRAIQEHGQDNQNKRFTKNDTLINSIIMKDNWANNGSSINQET